MTTDYLNVIRELEGHLEVIKGFMDGHLTQEQCTPDDVYNCIEQSLNLVEVLEELNFEKPVKNILIDILNNLGYTDYSSIESFLDLDEDGTVLFNKDKSELVQVIFTTNPDIIEETIRNMGLEEGEQ